MSEWEEIYNAGIRTVDLPEDDTEKAIEIIGRLIDASDVLGRKDGLDHALRLAARLIKRDLSPENDALLRYFVGNAHSVRLALQTSSSTADPLNWESEDGEKTIWHYRLAHRSKGFEDLPKLRRCQILTNLANTLHKFGRPIEALRYYDMALEITPSFSMARANRAIAGNNYASTFYDRGHAEVFYRFDYADLATALSDPHLRSEMKVVISAYMRELEDWYRRQEIPERVHELPDLFNHSFGNSSAERSYRRWCLKNGLFLNSLNDLGPYPIGVRDILTTPSMTAPLEESLMGYLGFFNQMKQEFVSARYLFYEALHTDGVHFSDREVLLHNTLDYPAYDLGAEKVKLAFRALYSVFDKIAFFLNEYLALGIRDRDVGFKTFWYKKRTRQHGIRQDLLTRTNRPLRGLFWLSKDLYEQKEGFSISLEPDAQQLELIRQHLEHRYLKLHSELHFVVQDDLQEDLKLKSSRGATSWSVAFEEDHLALSIGRHDFEVKTLRLMKLVREALIYLSLSINIEERDRAVGSDVSKTMPRYLDCFEDDWKRRL